MTPKEINILLKDLCARLPYGVKVQCYRYPRPVTVLYAGNIKEVKFAETGGIEHIDSIKPYLRPMSSMTDEEKSYVQQCIDIVEAENYGDSYSPAAWDAMSDFTNYCYERHLDLHGLIPKGLALNAPEEMYENK